VLSVTDIVTIPVISIFFQCQPLLHQSPIRIKACCGSCGSSTALSAFRGPEKLRFQAVSNGLFQVSWLLASPMMAHGVGSKDVDYLYKYWVERLPIRPNGFANPTAGSPIQPVLM
jgi:hypothetical protein